MDCFGSAKLNVHETHVSHNMAVRQKHKLHQLLKLYLMLLFMTLSQHALTGRSYQRDLVSHSKMAIVYRCKKIRRCKARTNIN